MDKRSSKRGRVVFDWRRFLLLMMVGFCGIAIWSFWENSNLPTSKNLESGYVKTAPKKDTLKPIKPMDGEDEVSEVDLIRNEIHSRQEHARSIFEADAGVLYVDESYGGNPHETESETPIAKLSIPSLDMEREIWVGIGSSPNGLSGFGDDYRLYKSATYRANQTLGGDNFTVVSHVWNGESFGRDFSQEWFSPLLNSIEGGMTTDLSKIKIRKGDKIFVEEFRTNLSFEFEVSEIRSEPKSGADGSITPEVKELLSARIDKPRITLQGCLMNTDKLVFVVAELKTVSNGSVSWSFE